MELAELFVKRDDIDINCHTQTDETALTISLRHADPFVADLLLKQPGIDVACTTSRGWTPLHFSAQNGFFDFFSRFLSQTNPNARTENVFFVFMKQLLFT